MDKKIRPVSFVTPQIFWMSLTSFLNDVASEIIYPLIPIFLTSVLKSSVAFVGLVEGIAESTAAILKLFSGWLSDRLGKRKSIAFFGYALSNITRSLFFLVASPFQLLLVRFFDRVGKGIRTAPRDALLMQDAAAGDRGKIFGFNRAMDNAGSVVGPIVAFVALYIFSQNLRLTFMISAIPALAAVIIFWLKVNEKTAERPVSQAPPVTLKSLFDLKEYNPQFRIFLFIILIFTLSNSSDAFLILRAQKLGVPIFWIPVLWLVFNLSKTSFNVRGGILSDKIGRSKTLFAGWLVYGLVYLGFGLAGSAWMAWALFILYGLYFGLNEGSERALIADLVPQEKLGTAYGIYNFAIGIMALPASVITGLIWQSAGYYWAFAFDAVLALVAAILVLTLVKK